jgi:hypothetical protein
MPVDFEIERPGEDETVLVLPYVRNFEDGRSNHGFQDMRGRPELIDAIVEAGVSPALKELLRGLAQPGCRYFSIGCDLRTWPPAQGGDLFQAAGYIQLLSADLAQDAIHRRRQMMLGRALEAHLDAHVGEDEWVVRFAVAQVDTADLGGPEQVWSPVIEFGALGETAAEAEASAERLLRTLRDLLAAEAGSGVGLQPGRGKAS